MNRGEHNKRGKTKELIVQCILVNPDGLEEPILRDYLHTKHNIGDQKTIKSHLEQLRKMGCIKKYEITGFPNRWKINKIEQFSKILDEFPGLCIDLQVNKVLVDLLLQKHRPILVEPDLQKYFKSFIEDSLNFLKVFLRKSPEEILKATKHIPEINTSFYNKYFGNVQIKDNMILKLYCISKILDILEVPWSERIENKKEENDY